MHLIIAHAVLAYCEEDWEWEYRNEGSTEPNYHNFLEDGESLGGPSGGPFGGPSGGPFGGPFAGPSGGPFGGPFGGPAGGPFGGPFGGPAGGPFGGPAGEPFGGPTGGPFGGPPGGGDALPFNAAEMQEKIQQFVFKCSKNMGGRVPDFIAPAMEELQQCAGNVVGGTPEQVQEEMMSTLGNTAQIGEFLKIKCKKRSTAFWCIDKFFKALNPCFTDEENEIKESLSRQLKRVVAFVCNEEGNYIQNFMDNDGPGCMQSKQFELQFCLQPLISKYSDFDVTDLNTWYTSEQCS